MARRMPETTSEWLEYFEKLRQRAADNYQQTGEARYYTQEYKYDVICEALGAKLREESERDDKRASRDRNIHAYIDKHLNNASRTYTHDEVMRMLLEMRDM